MDQNISVRFFRVDPKSDRHLPLGPCLEQLLDVPDDRWPEYERQIADQLVRVQRCTRDGHFIVGEIVRLQTSNFPMEVPLNARPRELVLPNGSRLGHPTAFVYDTRTHMLAYQMNKNSVGRERFNLYIANVCGVELFDMKPILQPAEAQRLNQITPKSLSIKVADPYGLEALEDTQRGLRDSLGNLKALSNGAYVTIKIGIGHARGGLHGNWLSDVTGWLADQYARKRGKVQQLKVHGERLDGEDEVLDFLRAPLGEHTVINDLAGDPDENFRQRLEFVKGAMLRNGAVLANYVNQRRQAAE